MCDWKQNIWDGLCNILSFYAMAYGLNLQLVLINFKNVMATIFHLIFKKNIFLQIGFLFVTFK